MNLAQVYRKARPEGITRRLRFRQNPPARTQKLSVHFSPAGSDCNPEYLPSCARFTPLMIVVKGSKQMNSRGCPPGPAGSQIVATGYLGPNNVSTVLPPDSMEKRARPSASRSR